MAYDGSGTLAFLKDTLHPDPAWTVEEEQGYTTAFSRFAQRVRWEMVEDPYEPGTKAPAFTITTGMLEGVGNTRENLAVFNERICKTTSLNIPVFDQEAGTFSLCLRVVVHEGIAGWMRRLLSIAMVLQMHEVLRDAEALAGLTGARPLYWRHPQHGIRDDVDEILDAYDKLIVPAGTLPGACTAAELRAVATTYLQRFPCVLTTYSSTGITTELPQDTETSLLRFDTSLAHPDYGNGLAIRHTFVRISKPYIALDAASLMNRQLAKSVLSYGMGSFLYEDGHLSYRAFLPNLAYQRGMLVNFFLATATKARTVNKNLGIPDWNKDSVAICLAHKRKLLSRRAWMFPGLGPAKRTQRRKTDEGEEG